MLRTFSMPLICAALVFAMTAADARPLSRILKDSGLSPEDFQIMGDTARPLYDTATPQAGSKADWVNEQSGSFGSVELVQFRDNCADLRHMVHPRGAADPREVRARWCKTEAGDWVLTPS